MKLAIYILGPTIATLLMAGLVFLALVAGDAVAGRLP